MALKRRRAGSSGKEPNQAELIQKKNKRAMNATVFGGSPVIKAESAQMAEDPLNSKIRNAGTIEPPLEPMVLTMMEENSSELRQCIDAMEINIEGFGGRLALIHMDEDSAKANAAAIKAEKRKLKAFLMNFHPEDNLTMFRRKSRREMELVGSCYWELIPNKTMTQIVAMDLVEAHTMRLTKQDKTSTQFTSIVIDPETGDEFKQTFRKKFRRFVQMRNSKKVFFKDWRDPRFVDRETGKAYKTQAAAKKAGVKQFAHGIFHRKLWSARTPYGMPRYVGNLFSIFGSRAAEEINYNTFLNNNVPSMAILVSGNAMLTEGTIKRINEFTQSIMKRSNNFSKFLLLEAEPATEGLTNSGTPKVEIERLKNEQHSDMLFQEYDENNSQKIRRVFRLPPIFVGRSTDYNRGTAETSKKLAEEQIFAPEREEGDRQLNMLLAAMGFRFWRYKSFSPNVTNDNDLVRLLSSIEKTGALTPNLAREIVGDIMNKELSLYDEETHGFDPEVPFSLTMAERVKNLAGNPGTGVLAPQGGQLDPEGKTREPVPADEKPKKNPGNDPNTEEHEKAAIEPRMDGLPVDENNDLDMTKMVDVFDKLNSTLNKSANWRGNAPGTDATQ